MKEESETEPIGLTPEGLEEIEKAISAMSVEELTQLLKEYRQKHQNNVQKGENPICVK